MNLKMQKALPFIFLLLLFWGGLGIALSATANLGLGVSLAALAAAYFANGRKLNMPKGHRSYLAFLAIILISFLVRGTGIEGQYFLTLFLAGGAFWLAFYNLEKAFGEKLINIILGLGIAFGALFVWYLGSGYVPEGGWNLYLFSTVYRNHNHLGDLWALVEIVILYKLVKSRAWYWWVLGLAGIFFLAASLSRSAYVAFFAGAAYLAYREKWLQKFSKILIPALAAPVLLFMIVGLFKTTLYSRLYFAQGILGAVKYPLGVGLGNFAKISNEIFFLDAEAKASLAHNIVLEAVAGVGVFAVFFIFWLLSVLVDIVKRGNILYSALFIALTANFFFDTTYYIPAMIWLWFALLGLAQAKR